MLTVNWDSQNRLLHTHVEGIIYYDDLVAYAHRLRAELAQCPDDIIHVVEIKNDHRVALGNIAQIVRLFRDFKTNACTETIIVTQHTTARLLAVSICQVLRHRYTTLGTMAALQRYLQHSDAA